jgi:hypothetical protein
LCEISQDLGVTTDKYASISIYMHKGESVSSSLPQSLVDELKMYSSFGRARDGSWQSLSAINDTSMREGFEDVLDALRQKPELYMTVEED